MPADSHLFFGNNYEGVELSILPDDGAQWFPVETVSNSEAGFERVYQGSCLIQHSELNVAAGATWLFTTYIEVRQSRDRAAEEAS